MQVLNKKSKNSTIKIVLFISITLLALGAYLLYAKGYNIWPFSTERTSESSAHEEVSGINYSPPTDQEVEDSQEAKKQIDNESGTDLDTSSVDEQSKQSTPSKQNVSVGISFADLIDGHLEVRAFTSGAIQGGSCTVTAAYGSDRITKKSRAFIDASSTVCEPLYIPESQLKPGVWSVSVGFESIDATGKSETVEVDLS